MRWVAAGFVVAAVALVAWDQLGAAPKPATRCGLECANAVSKALWSAWNTLDCDDPDVSLLDGSCNDDAQNVNTPASIVSVTRRPAGRFVVILEIRETSGTVDRFRETVHANGIVDQAPAPVAK